MVTHRSGNLQLFRQFLLRFMLTLCLISFAHFSKLIPDEDFARWDDYIEWQAYIKTANDLAAKMNEVKHGNFEIT